ncbi:hypothetical protein [Amycolatopsis sp. NBC_01480]|uniref:hypothetical protein n=1 Tax=Amycolatopsis sp. NBC_01480 TaxID=2903562 RepID=UPI002E2AB466|nr:hypothetical protein [Amycolatopsis sp. NBC_01480]
MARADHRRALGLSAVSVLAAVTVLLVRARDDARTVAQLDANLASLEVTIPDAQLAELDQVSRPQLDFPADLVRDVAPHYQQAGATINGVESSVLSTD